MAIFRRGRDDAQQPAGVADDAATGPEDAEALPTSGSADEPSFSRARGPFDASEVANDDAPRLDLGALRVPGVTGMELRLEVDEAQQSVVGVHAVFGDSSVQLQAFAAPRTGGLWPDIRAEIAQSIVEQGGTADVVDGPLGRELMARMPTRAADGRTVFQPVRFLGVDGPRWFLRAVISGRAALEEAAAERLVGVVRETVVVRGNEAMAPRELLPLRLPDEVAGGAEPPGGTGEGGGVPKDDLSPFQRGPESTEVR